MNKLRAIAQTPQPNSLLQSLMTRRCSLAAALGAVAALTFMVEAGPLPAALLVPSSSNSDSGDVAVADAAATRPLKRRKRCGLPMGGGSSGGRQKQNKFKCERVCVRIINPHGDQS